MTIVLMKRVHRRLAMIAIALTLSLLTNVSSAGVFGTNGNVAFDFVNGGLEQDNRIRISNFVVTGGSTSGITPFDQKDFDLITNFRVLFPVTFGTNIDFDFQILSRNQAPNFDDAFSLALLDSAAATSLIETSDVEALFRVDIDGIDLNGTLTEFSNVGGAPNNDISWTVTEVGDDAYRVSIFTGNAPNPNGVIPEPTSLLVWSLGTLGVVMARRRKSA